MSEFIRTITDIATGEITVVPFTQEEIAAHLTEQQKIADEKAALIAQEKTKAEAKAAAEAKLAALGLTAEEIAAISK